jgi:hypothetical protein
MFPPQRRLKRGRFPAQASQQAAAPIEQGANDGVILRMIPRRRRIDLHVVKPAEHAPVG